MVHTVARLAALCSLSAAVVIDHTGYPRYCAKDMSMFSISPVADASAASLDLVHVQIMVRHGARMPFSGQTCWTGYNETWSCGLRDQVVPVDHAGKREPAGLVFDKQYVPGQNVYNGNCFLGQMVHEGYTQQQQNGAQFRAAYVGAGPLALFKPDERLDLTNTSDIYFESTDMMRTIDSASIIVQSMFPDLSGTVPLHTGDLAQSFVTPNPGVCPALDKLNAAWLASDEYKAWQANATNVALETKLHQYIQGYNHVTLFDCLMTQRCTDKTLPNGMDGHVWLESATKEEASTLLPYFHNNNVYSRTAMAQYIHRIRTRLQDAVAGQGPRLILSAVHDTTLMPLLAALGGPTYLTEWVPYASHVVVELYHEAKTRNHFFRLLYQGKPLPVPGCATEICPVSAFYNMTEFATDPNVCGKDQTFAPALVTEVPTPNEVVTKTEALPAVALNGASTTTVVLVGLGGVVAGVAVGFFATTRCVARAGYSPV